MGGNSSYWWRVATLSAVLLLSDLPLLTFGQCMGGRFGTSCQHYCHCQEDEPCDITTGVCPMLCAEGYKGPTCQAWNAALGGGIIDDTHLIGGFVFDGTRSTCMRQKDATYTVQLTTRVPLDRIRVLGMIYFLFDSKPENAEAMNVTSGDAQCRTSFGGDKSMSEVSVSCPGVVGDRFTLRFQDGFYVVTRICEIEVLVCTNGFFGQFCHEECGRCRDGASCEQVSGNCTGGCQPGYAGMQCFDTCPNGTYGQDCVSECGRCAGNETCNHVTGTCADGCAPGWWGRKCDQRCRWGTFGHDCEYKCQGCKEDFLCHHETGECLTVAEKEKEEEVNDTQEIPLPREVKERAPLVHGPSLGGGVMLAVLLALTVLAAVWFVRRRAGQADSPLFRIRSSISSVPNLLAPNMPPAGPPPPEPPGHYETPTFSQLSQAHGSYDSLNPRRPETGEGSANHDYERPITSESANVYEELPERQPKSEEPDDSDT